MNGVARSVLVGNGNGNGSAGENAHNGAPLVLQEDIRWLVLTFKTFNKIFFIQFWIFYGCEWKFKSRAAGWSKTIKVPGWSFGWARWAEVRDDKFYLSVQFLLSQVEQSAQISSSSCLQSPSQLLGHCFRCRMSLFCKVLPNPASQKNQIWLGITFMTISCGGQYCKSGTPDYFWGR